MTLTVVSGDPLLTRAQTMAFGSNMKGRSEVGALGTQLLVRYPAAFSTYYKLCKSGRASPGTYWFWQESQPNLAFLIVRESAVGATRLRYVQAVSLALARDHRLLGIKSLAIAPLGRETEWSEIRPILNSCFADSPIPIVVYAEYRAGVRANEGFL